MFNEQVKRAFIEKYTNSEHTKKLLLYIFDSTEDTEEKYGVDIYAMNTEQVQETFNSVTGIKVRGVKTILMIFKAYVRWCVASGYPATNAVSELRIDVHDKINEEYVSSPLHLKRTLDAAFPHPEENEIEYIYRSFLWLGFTGLQVSEAIRVTDDELDFETDRLHFPDCKEPYRIYSESKPDLIKAVRLTTFREPRGKSGVVKQRAAGHEILRGKEGGKCLEKAIYATFRPTISRAFKEALERHENQNDEVSGRLSLGLTFRHAYMSGIFYRILERERAGVPVRFDQIIIKERRNAKEPAFSGNYTERKLMNDLIRDLEVDYANWKCAF